MGHGKHRGHLRYHMRSYEFSAQSLPKRFARSFAASGSENHLGLLSFVRICHEDVRWAGWACQWSIHQDLIKSGIASQLDSTHWEPTCQGTINLGLRPTKDILAEDARRSLMAPWLREEKVAPRRFAARCQISTRFCSETVM